MGAWEQIVNYIATSNITSIDFTGLNITRDDLIKIVVTANNPQTTYGVDYQVYPNNDDTFSNFLTQGFQADDTSESSSRVSWQKLGTAFGNRYVSFEAHAKLTQDYRWVVFSDSTTNDETNYTGPRNQINVSTSISTYTSGINTLTFRAIRGDGVSVSDRIGTNSRIEIYRLNAEKLGDVTLTNNTTTVDFTGLNLTKQGEYLLIADTYFPDSGASNVYNLYPNNQTNNTNYYTVYDGYSSNDINDASIARVNFSWFAVIPRQVRNFNIVSIRISNTNRYTHQSYQISGYDNINDFAFRNLFTLSELNNITNINELKIQSNQANQLGSTSRFELYKLY